MVDSLLWLGRHRHTCDRIQEDWPGHHLAFTSWLSTSGHHPCLPLSHVWWLPQYIMNIFHCCPPDLSDSHLCKVGTTCKFINLTRKRSSVYSCFCHYHSSQGVVHAVLEFLGAPHEWFSSILVGIVHLQAVYRSPLERLNKAQNAQKVLILSRWSGLEGLRVCKQWSRPPHELGQWWQCPCKVTQMTHESSRHEKSAFFGAFWSKSPTCRMSRLGMKKLHFWAFSSKSPTCSMSRLGMKQV